MDLQFTAVFHKANRQMAEAAAAGQAVIRELDGGGLRSGPAGRLRRL